jgi:hypothetical protein
VDRARLLVPQRAAAPAIASTRSSSTTAGPTAELRFLVPGVPESSQAYALSPAGMRAVPLQRVAGGTRLALPATGNVFALVTEDPLVIQSLRQRVTREGPRFVRLQRELLAQQASLVADNARRLAQLGLRNDASARVMASLDASLRQLDAQLAAGRLEQAFEIGNDANEAFAQYVAEQLRGAGGEAAFDSNPLSLSYEQLADYAEFQRASAKLVGGENLLYGGDFEVLEQMLQFGWQHIEQPLQGVETRVELSATEAKHGRYCLALHSTAAATDGAPAGADRATEWIVSPRILLEAGQIIEITGWVRVDEAPGENGEGLQIVDSLGGPELSIAVRRTASWQPFRMVRVAASRSELRLSFALAGLGSARIDGVMVRALAEASPRRLPLMEGARQADVAKGSGPLLPPPQPQ